MNEEYRRYLAEGEQAGMRYALQVPHTALSGMSGIRSGRMTGTSLDFEDYREYQPGDDLRTIDWGIYARSDRLTVKLYREEVSPHVDIALDCSRSMALEESDKARALLGLAGVIAASSVNADCTHSAWVSSETFRRVGNGTQSPGLWEGIDFDSPNNPGECLRVQSPLWHRLGIRVLISDLLWMDDPLEVLRSLSNGAAAVAVIQVLARQDVDPPMKGSVRLYDVETEQNLEIFVDAMTQQRYRDDLARHQQSWQNACRQTGAVFGSVVAEDLVDGWDMGQLEDSRILEPV